MANCIFCRIVSKELKAKVLFEDPEVLAFADLNPQAPVHVLVVPKFHIPSLAETTPAHMGLLGKLIVVAKDLARQLKIEDGFRLVFNTGARAGMSVAHVHLHLLGGRQMNWPPG